MNSVPLLGGVRWDVNVQWARNRSAVLDLAGTQEISLTGFTDATNSYGVQVAKLAHQIETLTREMHGRIVSESKAIGD